MATTELAKIKALLTHEEMLLRTAYKRFTRKTRSPSVLMKIVKLVRAHDSDGAVELIRGQLRSEFTNEIPNSFIRIAHAEIARAKTSVTLRRKALGKSAIAKDDAAKIDFSFDPYDEDAVDLMNKLQLDFLDDFTAKQKRAIKAALSDALGDGQSYTSAARAIRDSIGLTETQWQSVNNYRSLLENGSSEALQRKLRDRRFDSTVENAIDSNDVLEQSQIDNMVDRYTDRMIDYRANNIARTESHRVLSAARNEAWQQTVDQLGLDSNEFTRMWNSTEDARVRDTHADMDGQTVEGFEPFVSPSGVTLAYPGDPSAPAEETINCRCVETYSIG